VTSTGISCGADCSEFEFDGKAVILTATPAAGSQFVGFGGACVSSTKTCNFVPSGNSQNVSATFALIPYTLTVILKANGHIATLNSPPDPIDCGGSGSDCSAILDYNTPVTLYATPISGSRFVNWTGVTCAAGATNATCAFPLRGNITATPTFRDVTTVALSKTGQGTIVSTPAGINCGATCLEFSRGVVVKLTATPATGWSFTGWAGDPTCSGTGPCSFNASVASVL
jgi:hypothetical protein